MKEPMIIKRYIKKNGRKYEFVKVYPNYIQYRDVETKRLICFQLHDLGLVKEIIPRPKVSNDKKNRW